ncbi:MAG: SusD/RagB family nutrient-binding outer membrane lipoprotein [Chitinophagaceae bacterium]|nr:SusD/RagB family nutrient-binding outer membrane lipoprotein [Chitinophagaceae bacterium]
MKRFIIAFGFLASASVMLTRCTKKIDEAYANPNADVRVPIEQMLPNMIATMATNGAGHGPLNDIRFIGKYIQNFVFCNSGGRYDQMGGTTGTSDNAASIWRIHFYDLGQNVLKMIQWGTEEGKPDYVGAGQAILAWSWLTLSDYHGEVIDVNEAFNTSALTFKYGTQEQVYNHVKQLCYSALENLNKAGDQANFAKGDAFFYNGDNAKWKKFVNGIMARLYNHLSNKSVYNADSVVYYCNNSILANADNALVKFANTGISGTANFFGPLRGNLGSTSIGTETAIRQSAFIANLMSGANNAFLTVEDPRAWYMLRPNTNNTFVGLQPNKGQSVIGANDRPESFFGIAQTGSTANNTAPANDANCRYLFRNDSPFPVMTASEIAFIKAEALFRKGDKTGALTAYKNGIDLNFDMLTTTYSPGIPTGREITPTMKTNFLNNTLVVPASGNDLTLTKIMLQKYIALYIHGACETWVDMRRFHYTDIDALTGQQVYRDFVPPSGSDLNVDNAGKLVYRVRPRYNSEYVWNMNELIRIGADPAHPDYHTKECWFSQP